MRLISYRSATGPRIAAARNGSYVDLHEAAPGLPTSMNDFLALGSDGLKQAAAAIPNGQILDRSALHLLAPSPEAEKILCIGLNYADHAAESGQAPPAEPVVFNKFPTAIAAHEEEIPLPRLSNEVDYEAELVVVIGREGRHIPREKAFQYVAGYACGHDVSARDWQLRKPGGQWLLGKSFDHFAPFGPELVTADELGDPGALDIVLRLNDTVMQQSNTRQLIFPVDQLISHISGVCTLKPGDVLFTGTPPGVGAARKPPVFLQPGDCVEVEIEKIGCLRNRFVAES